MAKLRGFMGLTKRNMLVFFTDKGSAQVTDADAFDAAEGMILSEIPAGTEICVLACAETADAGYPASDHLQKMNYI